jgi:uncharacterized protein YchJ
MECECESCSIEEKGASCPCGSEKSYEECCGKSMDPVQHAKMMWYKAFLHAMQDAQVERLRKRIETSFGSTMDKVADAVIESMGKHWQSMVVQSEAEKDLEAKLQKIYSEASKK